MAVTDQAPNWAGASIENPPYDLVIHSLPCRGSIPIDPTGLFNSFFNGPSPSRFDVAIKDGKVVRADSRIPLNVDGVDQAAQIFYLGKEQFYIRPIDTHGHLTGSKKGAPWGIDADPFYYHMGVPEVVDAGSCGPLNFKQFYKDVFSQGNTKIYCYLNVAPNGLIGSKPHGELLEVDESNFRRCVNLFSEYPDELIGIKIRLGSDQAGDSNNQLKALRLGIKLAKEVNKPLMIHIGKGSDLSMIFSEIQNLPSGAIITHCFHPGARIIDESGKLLPFVVNGLRNGVRLDLGNGAGGFSFEVGMRAAEQIRNLGLEHTYTLGSDCHRLSVRGPARNYPEVVSKGVVLEEGDYLSALNLGSRESAKTLGIPYEITASSPGPDTFAVWEVVRVDLPLRDAHGKGRMATQLIFQGVRSFGGNSLT